MALTFSGGSALPAVGTAAYNAAASAPSGQGSYNASTGVLSSGGSAIYNPATSPVPTTITGANTAPTGTAQIPPPPTTPNYTGMTVGNNAGLAGNGAVYNPATGGFTYTNPYDQANANNTDNLKTLLATLRPPVNTADIYNQEYANNGIQEKQQSVQNYTNQLNTIVAKSQADQLSVTGQGRGIPEVIIGGQQAQIAKEAAIQALPIQAQLAAAQGNLQLAQEHLDTVFKLKAQDAQNQNDYYNTQAKMVYDFATTQEKNKLDYLVHQSDTNLTLFRDAQIQANSLATKAIDAGQPQLAASITSTFATAPTDTYASDYSARLKQITAQLTPYIGQIEPANKFTSVTNPLTGAQTAFNTKTGQYGASTGGSVPTPSSVNPPIISGNTTAHPPTGNPIIDQAQQLVDGNAVPNISGKLTPRDLAIQEEANRLSLAQTGKPYSAIDAAAAYKFRNSKQYTQFIANAPVAISTINTIVNDIHQLNDSGFSLNGIDAYNMAKLNVVQFNPFADPTKRAIAKELVQTLGSISADDIGLLLGSGSGSDYKTKLGGAIFDVSGNLQSTDRISQTIKDRIQAKLNDYYRIAGVSDPSIYATRDTQAITGVTNTGSSLLSPDGKSQVKLSDLTPAQIQEAKNAGWK